jgi:hypothetical protein
MSSDVRIWKQPAKSKKLCSCCDAVAKIKIEIRTSWFRGDDEVYLACDEHKALIEAEKWDEFYHDFAITKTKRSSRATNDLGVKQS